MSLAISLLLILIALTFLISGRAGAPWMPTSREVRRKMLELLELAPGETLIDLGSGDGGLLIEAARRHRVRAVGYEVNPILVFISKIRAVFTTREGQITVHCANIFEAKLESANAVVLFLMPQANERVRRDILPQLAPGTRIVSYAFGFDDLRPARKITDTWGKPIFLYVTSP